MIPNGLSKADASALIVNAEQAIFDGNAISNRKAPYISCVHCNVKMPAWVKYCPKCAMKMAEPIDLKGEKPKKWKLTKEQKEAIYGGLILVAMAFAVAAGITCALKFLRV